MINSDVDALEHDFYEFPYIWNHHPNWRTHIFQRCGSTTNQDTLMLIFGWIPQFCSIPQLGIMMNNWTLSFWHGSISHLLVPNQIVQHAVGMCSLVHTNNRAVWQCSFKRIDYTCELRFVLCKFLHRCRRFCAGSAKGFRAVSFMLLMACARSRIYAGFGA